MIKFEIGKTYSTHSTRTRDFIFNYTVIERSDRFITIRHEKRVSVKASYCGGYETALPEGYYRWCPVISAEKPDRKPFPAPASREQSLAIAKFKTMTCFELGYKLFNENTHS